MNFYRHTIILRGGGGGSHLLYKCVRGCAGIMGIFFSSAIIIRYVFGVGVSCRNLYFFVVYLYVNGSGSITSVGEERANLSAVVYL